jgi:DNA (cytosine-5)-methyltransferase 1
LTGGFRSTDLDGNAAYVVEDVSKALTASGHKFPRGDSSEETLIAFVQNQRDEVRTMKVAGALAAEPGMKQQTYLFEASRRDGIRIHDDTTPTLQSFMGTGGNNMPMVTDPKVRRLTPLECERLQGFPDGWTEGNSDTQRYRQLGNAVSVPVVEWIVNRLE